MACVNRECILYLSKSMSCVHCLFTLPYNVQHSNRCVSMLNRVFSAEFDHRISFFGNHVTKVRKHTVTITSLACVHKS